MTNLPCSHQYAGFLRDHNLFWCPECGGIARRDGRLPLLLERYQHRLEPPPVGAWYSPVLPIEQAPADGCDLAKA